MNTIKKGDLVYIVRPWSKVPERIGEYVENEGTDIIVKHANGKPYNYLPHHVKNSDYHFPNKEERIKQYFQEKEHSEKDKEKQTKQDSERRKKVLEELLEEEQKD